MSERDIPNKIKSGASCAPAWLQGGCRVPGSGACCVWPGRRSADSVSPLFVAGRAASRARFFARFFGGQRIQLKPSSTFLMSFGVDVSQ